MAKGYIKAQNGEEIEIYDKQARTDISSIKTQLAKFSAPSGELEITENGTFDVTSLASVIVNVLSGGSASGDDNAGGETGGSDGGSTGNSNIDCFIFTHEAGQATNDTGWQFEIPHNLGDVPDYAVVMTVDYVDNAGTVFDWRGTTGCNLITSNSNSFSVKYEKVSIQDNAAPYLYADAEKIECRANFAWPGRISAGTRFLVACGILEAGE